MVGELAITPLTSSIGARVEGLDLRRDVSEDSIQQVRDALWEHFVLVFPNQHVGLEEQYRLTSFFGELAPVPVFTFLGENNAGWVVDRNGGGIVGKDRSREYSVASALNGRERKGIDIETRLRLSSEFQGWHADASFAPQLNQAASLRAEVIPPTGGDTSFASLCAAYDGLSAVMQRWCESLKAVHAKTPDFNRVSPVWEYGPDAEERFDLGFPPHEHPVVVEHPHSHRKALFLNPHYVVRIAGLTDKESINILRFLYNHIATSDFVYRHHWSPGDIVVWDELVCLHLAPPADYHPDDRRLVRVTAGLVTPTAPNSTDG